MLTFVQDMLAWHLSVFAAMYALYSKTMWGPLVLFVTGLCRSCVVSYTTDILQWNRQPSSDHYAWRRCLGGIIVTVYIRRDASQRISILAHGSFPSMMSTIFTSLSHCVQCVTIGTLATCVLAYAAH